MIEYDQNSNPLLSKCLSVNHGRKAGEEDAYSRGDDIRALIGRWRLFEGRCYYEYLWNGA